MKMTNSEMRVLKRQMLISEMNDSVKDADRDSFLKAMKGQSDWTALWYSLIGIGIVMLLNYWGITYKLEAWLR